MGFETPPQQEEQTQESSNEQTRLNQEREKLSQIDFELNEINRVCPFWGETLDKGWGNKLVLTEEDKKNIQKEMESINRSIKLSLESIEKGNDGPIDSKKLMEQNERDLSILQAIAYMNNMEFTSKSYGTEVNFTDEGTVDKVIIRERDKTPEEIREDLQKHVIDLAREINKAQEVVQQEENKKEGTALKLTPLSMKNSHNLNLLAENLKNKFSKEEETNTENTEEDKEMNIENAELKRWVENYNEQVAKYKQIENNLSKMISDEQKKINSMELIVNGLNFKNNDEKIKISNRMNSLQSIGRILNRLPEYFNKIKPAEISIPELAGDEDEDYNKIREIRESSGKLEKGLSSFIKDRLLYAYDGIEKTLREEVDEETSKLFERYGVTKIYDEMNNKFLDFAKNIGLEKMDVKQGDQFDEKKHTALGVEKDETGIRKNEEIRSVGRSGFNYNGELVRSAEVVVWTK